MPIVRRRPLAERDLIEIWAYIAADSDVFADATLDRIEAKLLTLAGQPMLGRARPELRAGLRSFAVGNYVLFYDFDERGITLVRVLHGARDIDRQFDR